VRNKDSHPAHHDMNSVAVRAGGGSTLRGGVGRRAQGGDENLRKLRHTRRRCGEGCDKPTRLPRRGNRPLHACCIRRRCAAKSATETASTERRHNLATPLDETIRPDRPRTWVASRACHPVELRHKCPGCGWRRSGAAGRGVHAAAGGARRGQSCLEERAELRRTVVTSSSSASAPAVMVAEVVGSAGGAAEAPVELAGVGGARAAGGIVAVRHVTCTTNDRRPRQSDLRNTVQALTDANMICCSLVHQQFVVGRVVEVHVLC
jgi:hypothetical protein